MKKDLFQKEKILQKASVWQNLRLYWELAVCLTFLSILAASFFGYYLFMQTDRESMADGEQNIVSTKTIKKERIDAVLEYFSKRREESGKILSTPSPVIDPSL